MRLWDRLDGRRDDEVLWIYGADGDADGATPVDVAALEALRGRLPKELLRGRRVALLLTRPHVLAEALVLLDGVASSLLLLPGDLDDEVARSLLDTFGADLVFIDASSEMRPEESGTAPLYVPWRGGVGPELPTPPSNALPAAGGEGEAESQWVLATSGTTAEPKLVAHTLRSLTRTTRPVGSSSEPGAALRWGLLYSLERFAGLQVFLQTLWSEQVLLMPAVDLSEQDRFRFLLGQECSAISCTPSWARRMLQSAEGSTLPLRQITLGGEIADDTVLRALARAFPEARLLHIYASTEAGVGFVVRDGRAGFPVDFTAGSSGVEVEVRQGRLWLRPAVVSEFLRNRGEGGAQPVADADGWVDTGDLVMQHGDRFLFLGRAEGAINVGGSKVMPEEVESVILEVDGVADCLVRGRRSGLLGQIVEAHLLLARDLPEDERALEKVRERVQDHCSARLPKFKVPSILRVVTDLELLAAGKKGRTFVPALPGRGGPRSVAARRGWT